MQYKLSKNDWIQIGQEAGWLKTASGGASGHYQVAPQTAAGSVNFPELEKLINIENELEKLINIFKNPSVGEMRSFVDSIPEEKAKEVWDMTVLKRDVYIDNANDSLKLGMKNRHMREKYEKSMKMFIMMSADLRYIQNMMMLKFPNLQGMRQHTKELMEREEY